MFYLFSFFTKCIKIIFSFLKKISYFFILLKYFILFYFKKNNSPKKHLYYGNFFLKLDLFNLSKNIISKIPKNSKEYKYAQFLLGSYIFNNLRKNPEVYLNEFFYVKTNLTRSTFYPPKLIIYNLKKRKINLLNEIEKYIKSNLQNSYSDLKQKEIYRYYQSEHNIHKLKKFKFFAKLIEKELNKKKNYLFEKKNSHKIKINKMWFVKSRQGVDLLSHNHPEGIISGIYYYKVPKEKSPGFLIIKDPKKNIKIISDLKNYYKKDYEIIIRPVENSIIIFNSYIMHSVVNQTSQEERISIPFDANIFKN